MEIFLDNEISIFNSLINIFLQISQSGSRRIIPCVEIPLFFSLSRWRRELARGGDESIFG